MKRNTHILVLKTAREIGDASFEIVCSRSNHFYAKWKGKRRLWVAENIAHFLPQAREALTNMLTNPNVPDSTKEVIHHALVYDAEMASIAQNVAQGTTSGFVMDETILAEADKNLSGLALGDLATGAIETASQREEREKREREQLN